MKRLRKNVWKGWITTLIGIATMVITLNLVYVGKMDFVWNGIAGLAIGTTLVLAPRTIEKKTSEIISRATTLGGSPAPLD